MNELLKTKLFCLLSEPSQVTNGEIQSAYDDFVAHMSTLSQSEVDASKIFRILNFTRIEFDFIGTSHRYEQGEKCFEICIL